MDEAGTIKQFRRSSAITPHATNALPSPAKGILCTGAGNLVARIEKDAADVTIPMTAGQVLSRLKITHVRATSTGSYSQLFYS